MSRPRDIREQYERKLTEAYSALGEKELELKAVKKAATPARRGRELIKSLQAELAQEGHRVSISKHCEWLGMSRRIYDYPPGTRMPVVDEEKARQVKSIIERPPRVTAVLPSCWVGTARWCSGFANSRDGRYVNGPRDTNPG